MLDTDALLTAYLDRYWGYGSLDVPWWFVGMEEGGQPDWDEFAAFLHGWHRRGAPAMRDFRPPATERGNNRWFRDRPAIQPYWAKLIRTRLAADQQPVDTEPVRGKKDFTFQQVYFDSGPNRNGDQFFRVRIYGKDRHLQGWSIDRIFLKDFEVEPEFGSDKTCED